MLFKILAVAILVFCCFFCCCGLGNVSRETFSWFLSKKTPWDGLSLASLLYIVGFIHRKDIYSGLFEKSRFPSVFGAAQDFCMGFVIYPKSFSQYSQAVKRGCVNLLFAVFPILSRFSHFHRFLFTCFYSQSFPQFVYNLSR